MNAVGISGTWDVFLGNGDVFVVVVDVVVVVFKVDDVADDATPSSLMTSRVFSTTWLALFCIYSEEQSSNGDTKTNKD